MPLCTDSRMFVLQCEILCPFQGRILKSSPDNKAVTPGENAQCLGPVMVVHDEKLKIKSRMHGNGGFKV